MLAFPLALLALALPPGSDRAATLGAAARSALDAGSSDEALKRAEEALEWSPEDLALLDLAAQAAEADKEPDRALCYAAQALELATAPENAALAEALRKRIADLDPLGGKGKQIIGEYSNALLALGRNVGKRKLFVNGVDFSRSRGTPSCEAAEAELAKIYDNKKAVEALIESGLDVPWKAKKKRAPEAAAEDAKHATWATAWEVKGEQYTVKTDFPREMADSISLAMEQMNAVLPEGVPREGVGGGQTARVTLCVYKDRDEFDPRRRTSHRPERRGLLQARRELRRDLRPAQRQASALGAVVDALPRVEPPVHAHDLGRLDPGLAQRRHRELLRGRAHPAQRRGRDEPRPRRAPRSALES